MYTRALLMSHDSDCNRSLSSVSPLCHSKILSLTPYSLQNMENMASGMLSGANEEPNTHVWEGEPMATMMPTHTVTLATPNSIQTASIHKVYENERTFMAPLDEAAAKASPPPIAISVPSLNQNDSDDEDIIDPSRRRKRSTNNPPLNDLDSEDIEPPITPPSAKRLQFNMNIPKGIYVGLWAHSPEHLDSRKHAIYAYIDKTDKMRARIHPETRDGVMMYEGFPVGPGVSMVKPKDIIYEPFLSTLSHLQRKEYVRIRTDAIERGESSVDRLSAEKQAVLDAVEAVKVRKEYEGDEVIQINPSAPTTPQPKATPSSVSQKNRPNDVLLGYWKESLTPLEADRHAAYGKVQSDGKFRVRVARETRDGRPMSDYFPSGRSPWIDFDEVVLDPHLANVTRLEIKDYTWNLQQKDLKGLSNNQRMAAQHAALISAKANVQEVAKAAGIGIQELDADREAKRRQANESRKGVKVKAAGSPEMANTEPHRISLPTFKKRGLDTPVTRSWSQPTSKKIHLDSPVTRSSEKSRDEIAQSDAKAGWAPRVDVRDEGLRKERDAAMERATALSRTQHAKADAARVKEGLGVPALNSGTSSSPRKAKVYGTDNRSRRDYLHESDTPRPTDNMRRGKTSNGGPSGYAQKRDTPRSAEKMKMTNCNDLEYNLGMLANRGLTNSGDLGITGEYNGKTNTQSGLGKDEATTAKFHGGIKYERRNTGPFAGKLVGNQGSVITIDGEDYVEYRILMRTQF